VVTKAELMDYAPVKGCMVIRPYGYSIWEAIQGGLDPEFKATGHRNAYFPLFIPESFLKKEAEHFEGFTPQVAWVTRGGDEDLAERLAVRPTSEAVIGAMYSKWIQSYRDLPVLINQWCNVVRWEKATRPFIRTSEFLWQEGHTCHRTEEEAERETLTILDIYRRFVEEVLAIPVVPGLKSESEKFAGALRTYTIEALMSDGRALQAGTAHNLGQHFAKVFDITYLDQDGQLKYVWQSSWGVTTRLIGALVMVHGDDRGLVLPPRVAPIQVVIVPIGVDRDPDLVRSAVASASAALGGPDGVRLEVDDRSEYSPGWKFNEWEMRGVPLRLEIGPRDAKAGQVLAVRRDTGEKTPLPGDGEDLVRAVRHLLDQIQSSLFERARRFRDESTHRAASIDEVVEIMETRRGFAVAPWCGRAECEREVKERAGATIRCLPLAGQDGETPPDPAPCLSCGRESRYTVYFARAY